MPVTLAPCAAAGSGGDKSAFMLLLAFTARQSGINRIQIIDIEGGRKAGSVASLKKLASALKIDIDDLVVTEDE